MYKWKKRDFAATIEYDFVRMSVISKQKCGQLIIIIALHIAMSFLYEMSEHPPHTEEKQKYICVYVCVYVYIILGGA